MRRILVVFCIVFSLSFAAGSTAQAPNPDDIRGIAQNYLLEQMNREAVLLEFSFEGVTWNDGSLGCPQDGEFYTQAQVAGFQWQFLMDDGVRYNVHTDAFGQSLVLCPETSTDTLVYSTFEGSFFNIQHPNLWSVSPQSETDFIFSFRGQTACNTPQMRVLVTSQVEDSALLLDTYLNGTVPRENFMQQGLGFSAGYIGDCNGALTGYRVSALPGTTNVSYIVIQSVPAGIFDVWQPIFTTMLASFQPGFANLTAPNSTAPTAPPQPQDEGAAQQPPPTVENAVTALPATETPVPVVPAPPPPPPIDISTVPVIHHFLGDLYIGTLNQLPGRGLTRAATTERRHFATSWDGTQLAYIENGNELHTVNTFNIELPNELSTEASPYFVPTWQAEGAALAFMRSDNAIEIISPDGTRNATPELDFNDNCPDATGFRADALLNDEQSLLLSWLSGDRFLYTPNCDGTGLHIIGSNGNLIADLGDDLRHAAVSPRRDRVAAARGDSIVIINLDDLTEQTLAPSFRADLLAWDITGTQLYSVHITAGDPLLFDDESRQLEAEGVLGTFPYQAQQNTLTLFQIDTNNLVEVQLWQDTGYAVGGIKAAPDGSGILMTVIPSDFLWLTNFISQLEPNVVAASTPDTQLFWVPTRAILASEGEASNAQRLAFTSQATFATPYTNLNR